MAWLALPVEAPAAPIVSADVVAITGDPSPRGDVSFDAAVGYDEAPNEGGVIVGAAELPLGEREFFRGGLGGIEAIARSGDPLPDGRGFFSGGFGPVSGPADGGAVAFEGTIESNPQGERGIFRFDGAASEVVVRAGDAPPNGVGTFTTFLRLEAMNELGDVAFNGALNGSSVPDRGIFVWDSWGGVKQIARTGDAVPEGNGTISQVLSGASLNDEGHLAFLAELSGTKGGPQDDSGIYLHTSSLEKVAREGDPAPDGNGVFSGFTPSTHINAASHVAFQAELSGTPNGRGIFLFDGDGLVQRVRSEVTLAEGTEPFGGFNLWGLNDQGEIAFRGGWDSGVGLFVDDGSTLLRIARSGEPLPDGSTTFPAFRDGFSMRLTDSGLVAFEVDISETTERLDVAVFLFDRDRGLTQIVRGGDPFLGTTIRRLALGGINDRGQMVASFELNDGRRGVGIWSVPEPPALLLLLLLAAAHFRGDSRRSAPQS